MRNLLSFTILLFYLNISAQEPPKVSDNIIVDEIVIHPFYPGCEEREDPEMCFHQQMRNKITERLLTHINTLSEIGPDRFNSIVLMKINEEGKISEMKIETGNSVKFNEIVLKEMQKIVENIPVFIPAKNSEGLPSAYIYRIPVSFVFAD